MKSVCEGITMMENGLMRRNKSLANEEVDMALARLLFVLVSWNLFMKT